MLLTGLLLGLALLGPAAGFQSDTTRARPKPESPPPAAAKPPARAPLPEPRLEPKEKKPVKPLPLGEPKLKRRKNP